MAGYTKVGPFVNGAAPALSAANLDIMETQYDNAGYTEIAVPILHQATASDVWENWDISALVPAGTRAVLVGILVTLNGEDNGVRANGSALDRRFTKALGGNTQFRWDVCNCDVNRIIEIYDDNVAQNGEFYIMGYWG